MDVSKISPDHPFICLQVHNEKGKHRVVVTKDLPGERWLNVLKAANCRVEICQHDATILDNDTIVKLIGDDCMGVLGQLTEVNAASNASHREPVATVMQVFAMHRHMHMCPTKHIVLLVHDES